MFDDNGDGKISRQELTKMMSSLGQTPSEEEISAIMTKADKDGKLHASHIMLDVHLLRISITSRISNSFIAYTMGPL